MAYGNHSDNENLAFLHKFIRNCPKITNMHLTYYVLPNGLVILYVYWELHEFNMLFSVCILRAAASVQHDPVYNTVSVVNNHFHYQSWNAWVTHSIVRTQPRSTWVGILLTVWLLLTVCHEYGGGVGYDWLVLGLSFGRCVKIFILFVIQIYNLISSFWLSYSYCCLSSDLNQQST